jgi:hypothetical protein
VRAPPIRGPVPSQAAAFARRGVLFSGAIAALFNRRIKS